ncbi:MAG TPA: hypothetical protein VJG29_01050 [Candidatus Paceibacterota bacterium]
MREFNEKRLLRRVLFSWGSVLIVGTLLFFSVRGLVSVYERYAEARKLREAAEGRLGGLTERKDTLQAAITSLETGRGFEEEVRERFGVVRPGEGVIDIVEEKKEEGATGTQPSVLEWFLKLF